MAKEKGQEKETLGKIAKFSKKVILSFDKYSKRKDLLSVLLKDKKLYTIEEVDSIINKFMEG